MGMAMEAPLPLHPVVLESRQLRHQAQLWGWRARDMRSDSGRLLVMSVRVIAESREVAHNRLVLRTLTTARGHQHRPILRPPLETVAQSPIRESPE